MENQLKYGTDQISATDHIPIQANLGPGAAGALDLPDAIRMKKRKKTDNLSKKTSPARPEPNRSTCLRFPECPTA